MAVKISPETEALLTEMVAGIQKARPSTAVTPDLVISYALRALRSNVVNVFPEYFETKPARTERKVAA